MEHSPDQKILKKRINASFKRNLAMELPNPMVNATKVWKIAAGMIRVMLGENVYNQWFKSIKPLVLKNGVLILQTDTRNGAVWINTHYKSLANSILKAQNTDYVCFFVAPKEEKKKI